MLSTYLSPIKRVVFCYPIINLYIPYGVPCSA